MAEKWQTEQAACLKQVEKHLKNPDFYKSVPFFRQLLGLIAATCRDENQLLSFAKMAWQECQGREEEDNVK